MANLIKCPNCGENNLADVEFCQYCKSRLQPLTGNLAAEDQPLMPGQPPTKKSTADLEPVLPQWLRDARESARQSSYEEETQNPPQPASAVFSSGDLLAGLQSQTGEEEEEIPDWLANITGGKPTPKKTQPESSDVRWVELGHKKDFAQSEPESESELPSWLSGMTSPASLGPQKDDSTPESSSPFSSEQPPAGETQDWLHSMVADEGAVFTDAPDTESEAFISSDTPDWLRGLEASTPSDTSSATPAFSDTPDWLKAMQAESDAPKPDAAQPDEPSDTPDWLKAMQAESAPTAPSLSSAPPDWLKALEESDRPQEADPVAFVESDLSGGTADTSLSGGEPDWLKGLESAAPASDQNWLKDFQPGEEKLPPSGTSTVGDASETELPGWLKAAAPQSSIFDEPLATQPEPVSSADAFETTDWLKTFQSADESEPKPVSALPLAELETPASPASTGESLPPANEDSLFTEMPDWLSITDDTIAPESVPAPITHVDVIAPGDLPSWVQAMRPVDTGVTPSAGSLSSDRTLETRGALAGLQGVLPAVPGFAPVRKPKAHSIKLQASAEQQQHAGLLAQIISAETEPVPIDSFAALGASRGLRWTLAILVFAMLTAILAMRIQIFPKPTGFPAETVSVFNIVNDSIPIDGRVLVVFDYEPARAAEIETVAGPLFDRMIRARYPRLTFVSTRETGVILAERFISSGPLSELNYQTGSQYLNLGYLPGGGMGIRAFVEAPFSAAQYALPQSSNLTDLTPPLAKAFPPSEGVDLLGQFSALFLLTDDADSARIWIEQLTPVRGAIPFVVISSAQSAPMLQPYYASGQINGLASGLHGGLLFEQNDEGRADTAGKYWDAYNAGLLLAMALILGGGLISLTLGLRDRSAAREAK